MQSLYLTFQLLPLQPLSPGSVQAPADLPEFDLLDPHQETGPARPMIVKPTTRRPPSLRRGSNCVSHDTTVSEFLNPQKNPTSRQFKMTNPTEKVHPLRIRLAGRCCLLLDATCHWTRLIPTTRQPKISMQIRRKQVRSYKSFETTAATLNDLSSRLLTAAQEGRNPN